MRSLLLGILITGFLSNSGNCFSLGSLNFDQLLEDQLRANAGYFIDEILANLRKVLVHSGYAQVELPNATKSFSESFFGVTWQGEASAYNGVLRGLETIHRIGPANLKLTDTDFVFSSDLGFDRVNVTSGLKARFMGYGPEANVTGKLQNMQCFLEAKTSRTNPGKVVLTKLDIHDIGQLQFDIKGLGPMLDYVAEGVVGALGNLVKGTVANLVEHNMKDLINSMLDGSAFNFTPAVQLLRI